MNRLFSIAGILLMTLGLATIAHAQLASYVDSRGNVIFINGDPPPSSPKTKKATASGGAAQNAVAKAAASSASGASSGAEGNSASGSAAKTETSAANSFMGSAPAASGGTSSGSQGLDKVVEQSAEKYHVDPALVRAVISTESSWNSAAVSPKGAQGLMQLIPQTAQSLGVDNAFDPAENIDGGVRYLSTLLTRYNGDVNKALAAYNAGPGAVDRFDGVPDYRETRQYVQKVTSSYLRPGSERQPRANDAPAHVYEPVPIYRTQDESGRVIFVNE